MGMSMRIGAVRAASAAIGIAVASGCSGDNRTMVCIQSDCRQYFGAGGGDGIFGPGPLLGGGFDAGLDAGRQSPVEPDAGGQASPDAGATAAECELSFLSPTASDAGSLELDGAS